MAIPISERILELFVSQTKIQKFKNRQLKHNPDEIIFNYSRSSVSDVEKSLLVRGLRFSLPPKKLNYADYLNNSELFYRNIRNLDVLSNGDLDFVKTKIKDAALSYFHFYNANVPQILSDEELEALDRLSKNKNLVIQKADKGNSMVFFFNCYLAAPRPTLAHY